MQEWWRLVGNSLLRPREAAREVLALGLGAEVLVQAALAVACIGIVLGYMALSLSPGSIDDVSTALLGVPLLGALVQFAVILVGGYLTYRVGRAFGGTGGAIDALALVVWLNVIMVLVQAVQVAAVVVVPPVAAILPVVAVVWALWAFANFVTELHDFTNPFFVLGGVILALIVLFFGLAMMLTMLGITPQESA